VLRSLSSFLLLITLFIFSLSALAPDRGATRILVETNGTPGTSTSRDS
jgi:hypothetical protein